MEYELDAKKIWHSGVAAVAPAVLIQENLVVDDQVGEPGLWVAGHRFSLKGVRRLLVVGAGKATAAMALGVEHAIGSELLGMGILLDGVISVPEGAGENLRWIDQCYGRPAGVNEPTEAGVEAARRMLASVGQTGPADIVLALISGGGSALLPLPIEGICLEDKLAVTRHLSGAGADIECLNVVRKQLSAIKGGRLAAACRAPVLMTLVLSDILGDPLQLIASGPTVADTSTPSDAIEILARFDPQRRLPSDVYRVLEERARDQAFGAVASSSDTAANPPIPDSRKSVFLSREAVVIGNNATAVDAAGIEAERLGYRHAMVSSRSSEGEAEGIGRHLAEVALAMLASEKADAPNCLISGGEPTVKLVPRSERGVGGRNQQLVLAALCRFLEEPQSTQRIVRDHLVFLSAGTDGEDGPTNAAGAFLSRRVWQNFNRANLDPYAYLNRNDAYAFFQQIGGLLITGPTGTNVCDLRVLVCGNAADRQAGE